MTRVVTVMSVRSYRSLVAGVARRQRRNWFVDELSTEQQRELEELASSLSPVLADHPDTTTIKKHCVQLTFDNVLNSVRVVSRDSDPSLGRDDHVRQVIPDCHQATGSNKTTLNIETWNVQTLYQTGKLDNVKWKGAGEKRGQEYGMIYSRGNDYQRGVAYC
ncbi:hypothetical protein PoB_002331700 [Plakobranchus ocellatus]|uniref:Uncharacterized protein n=1 Tax=Plakobranchus ocellatus TaxID=259542 RepID=A0AAV3ZNM5_9GAST|nr:hypothetical protein PoB_002331700 [Plakobranchus ocellatus]